MQPNQFKTANNDPIASNATASVAKNASFLMASQVVTWGLTLVLMIFLPRFLGASGVGQLHLADSIWNIVAIFVTFGMDTLLTKEIARRSAKATELVGLSLVLRLLFNIIGFGVVMIYVQIAGYLPLTVYVIYIVGIGKLTLEFSGAFRSSLIGWERMEYVALADIASRIFNTVVTIAILFMGYGVLLAAAVFIGTSITSTVIQYVYLKRLQPVRIIWDLRAAKGLLKASFPYLLVFVFSVLYMNLDAVIISLIINETVVGWYGVADRLFGTLMFIPTVFITAVFPVLSRMYTDAPDTLPRVMRRSYDLLLLVSVPIGLGIFVVADQLVVLLFGADFTPSGPVLAVMGLVIILTYQNILIGRFLISVDRQNSWTIVMAVATLVTIPLDLILIPWTQATFSNGAIGGALAFIVTEFGMTVAGLRLLPKGTLGKANVWRATRISVAGLVMLIAVWPLRDAFILIPISIGVVVYAGMIMLMRVLPKEDWNLFLDLGRRITRRFSPRKTKPAEIKG
jgi:O-antigen/teichoic acid export membrane protein